MALKKDNHSVDNGDEKISKDQISSADSINLDKKISIDLSCWLALQSRIINLASWG